MAETFPTIDTLAALVRGDTLTETQAEALFAALLAGELDDAQIGALLALLQARRPTADELTGAARAMRAVVTRVPFTPKPGDALIDTCGTGGAPKTFNVSTAAAIVAAAAQPRGVDGPARVLVAKHGNRSRTGRGSAEVLAELGVNIDAGPETQATCLDACGVCFSFAIRHHPAMKHAAGPRRSLGFPTVFNVLGPLTNPAGAQRQVLGVYDPTLGPLVARVLASLGAEHAMVAHTDDGLDELSITAPATVWVVRDGNVREQRIDPAELGFAPASLDDVRASDVHDAARLIRAVFEGRPGPHRGMVVINAAAALVVAGAAANMPEGVSAASEAIDSSAAAHTLEKLATVSYDD